ncbi:RNA polymerase sporulation sigma factor SigH [Neobacillus cucumis]|uniref:RNA polymerase sporulation sigma factor SigH n=1 Tax=Neobacillus cucumis TaxID=1740721 RepID=UPI0028535B65|nr:RNA polymerase sporulation sigma factor SigH [Neobacillus cucumis]MDR4950455.1 RNA polymerase sporulation sigma factor SigH [Neobacillus cucumis]
MVTIEKTRETQVQNDTEDKLLIEKIHNGESEHLDYIIKKYKYLVRSITNKYFLIGAEKEDLFQEGMIGLYKAIRDFRVGKMNSFVSFVDLCVNRQIITAIKTSTRKKHSPLNSYTSLNRSLYEGEGSVTLLDVLPGPSKEDPAQKMIEKEMKTELENKLSKLLSDLEGKVLMLYLEGLSYVEMAKELKTHIKSVDNALTRVKRKIESIHS